MSVIWKFSTKIFDSDDDKYITSHSEKKKSMFSSKTSWIIYKYRTRIRFTELEQYLDLYSGDLQSNIQGSSLLHNSHHDRILPLFSNPWNYNLTFFSKTIIRTLSYIHNLLLKVKRLGSSKYVLFGLY